MDRGRFGRRSPSSTPDARDRRWRWPRRAREEATLFYQQTIQRAFREVSDALVGYRRPENCATEEQLVASARDARRLADIRYRGGAASYLEVLDSDTRLFVAENELVQAQLEELAAFVEIYRALGGGWQQEGRPGQ